MSSLSDFLGGGGGGGLSPFEKSDRSFTISDSGTFTFPYAGTVDIYAIGAGGFGGLAIGDGTGNSANLSLIGTGGGAGGTAVKRNLVVSAGDTITIAVGATAEVAFGANIINANTTTNAGATTVNSNDVTLSLTANGGSNGSTDFSATATLTTASVSGGAGGTGSGGDENYTGGRGGNFSFTATPNVGSGFNAYRGYFGTGGGAVGLNANGNKGGDAVVQFNTGTGGGSTDEYCSIGTAGGSVGQDATTITVNSGGNDHNYSNATVSTAPTAVFDGTTTSLGSSSNLSGANLGTFGPGSGTDNKNTSRQFSLADASGGGATAYTGNAFNNTVFDGGLLGGKGPVFLQGNAGPPNTTYNKSYFGGSGACIFRHGDTGTETYPPQRGATYGAGGGAYVCPVFAPTTSTFNDNHQGSGGACVIRYKTITEA
jgi:hypothetical protein